MQARRHGFHCLTTLSVNCPLPGSTPCLLFIRLRRKVTEWLQYAVLETAKYVSLIFKDWWLCCSTIFSNEILCIFHIILQNKAYKIHTGCIQISHFCGTLCWVYFFSRHSVHRVWEKVASLSLTITHISWSICAIFSSLEIGMTISQFRVIYLLNSLMTS